MKSEPFIYGLFDAQDPGHVRYVGMAFSDTRPFDHSRNARKGSLVNPHLMHWVRKLHREGREYSVLILEQLPADCRRSLVGFVETCYIDSLRRLGHKLTNVASGGDGGNTNGHTPEVCAKIAAAGRLRKVSEDQKAKIRASLMGHSVSVETRQKQSEAKRKYFSDPANRLKRSQNAKASVTKETREKISASGLGRIVTAETRQKISNTLKARSERA